MRALSVLCAIAMLVQACKPATLLTSSTSRSRQPELRFRTGDSMLAQSVSIVRQGGHKPPVVVADSVGYAIDSLTCVTTSAGQHIVFVDRRPYLQVGSGRIDAYARYVLPPGKMSAASVWRVDLLQKFPDERLYTLSGKTLMRLTSDRPKAFMLANQYRRENTRATICVATGVTLLAAGVVTFLTGGVISDVDANYRRPYFIAGAAGAVAGTTLLVFPFRSFSRKASGFRNAALNTYNSD